MSLSVLQPWMEEIPIRMQSTLLLGLRGPDNPMHCPNIKAVGRWLRGLAFRPGNPDNVKEFMGHSLEVPQLIEKSPFAKELEFCTQHYYSHLMHAVEVVAYRHPDALIRSKAFTLFTQMCAVMHLPVELVRDFEWRLKEVQWPGGRQPDTFVDAVSLLDGEGR